QGEVRGALEHADDAPVRALTDAEDRFFRVVDRNNFPRIIQPRAQMGSSQKPRRTGSEDRDLLLHDTFLIRIVPRGHGPEGYRRLHAVPRFERPRLASTVGVAILFAERLTGPDPALTLETP